MSLTHPRKSLQTCCSVFTCCHTVHLACVPQTGPEREWFTEETLKNYNGLQISIASRCATYYSSDSIQMLRNSVLFQPDADIFQRVL